MKRYYFLIKNTRNEIVDEISVVATNLQAAKNKISWNLIQRFKNNSIFFTYSVNYHEVVK